MLQRNEDNSMDMFFKIIMGLIVVVVLAQVTFYICAGKALLTVGSKIEKVGLESVLMEIWKGKDR